MLHKQDSLTVRNQPIMDYRSMALGNSGFNDKKNWDPNSKQNAVRGFNLGQDQLKTAKELAKSKGLLLQMPIF